MLGRQPGRARVRQPGINPFKVEQLRDGWGSREPRRKLPLDTPLCYKEEKAVFEAGFIVASTYCFLSVVVLLHTLKLFLPGQR